MKEKIYLASPHMSEEGYEQEYIKEAFDTNWIAPLGNNVNQFEQEIAEYSGIGYAAALSSGTAAIHLALKCAGVGKGDIVFCQSLTFSASANPIIYEGAIPVFIDSEPDTWNMSPQALKKAFEKYQPKAVILVHLYGLSAKIEEIKELCDMHQCILIEDAAESLGTKYRGVQTGTFGDYGVLSFNGNKIITTSGGGMLLSNNKEAIEKSKFWATQSRENEKHYEHRELGYNYRLSNVLAGIGRGQLKVLDKRVEQKRAIFTYYKEELSALEGVEFPATLEESYSNHWLSVMLVKGRVTPNMIMDELATQNIESRPLWKPMHLQPYFREYEYVGESVAEDLFYSGICLPSDTKMTSEQQTKIIKMIKDLWDK